MAGAVPCTTGDGDIPAWSRPSGEDCGEGLPLLLPGQEQQGQRLLRAQDTCLYLVPWELPQGVQSFLLPEVLELRSCCEPTSTFHPLFRKCGWPAAQQMSRINLRDDIHFSRSQDPASQNGRAGYFWSVVM